MIKKKDLVTADLDKRFDELLELNLIEMPEEYYEEKVYFESTEALNELFTKLEEENLAKINKIQEVDESYEKAEAEYNLVKKNKES